MKANLLILTILLFISCSHKIFNELNDLEESEQKSISKVLNNQFPVVPGTVITHSPKSSKAYIGSPSIEILPNGNYVASHDIFGTSGRAHKTAVFISEDRGNTWVFADSVNLVGGQLFYHQDALYLHGFGHGDMFITKSNDGGHTWDPVVTIMNKTSTVRYQQAPTPFIVHNGRIWHATEGLAPPWGYGSQQSCIISADVNADLMNPSSWRRSNVVPFNPSWTEGTSFMEGNIVLAPDDSLKIILRVNPDDNIAAVIPVANDGFTIDGSSVSFINFPGARKKFTIRYDAVTGKYWSLTNYILPDYVGGDVGRTRNSQVLISSTDAVNWSINALVLFVDDTAFHGFQYLDWQFDGADIVAVSRTSYDDGMGGAANQHDSNFLTFHRFSNFRTRTTPTEWQYLLDDISDFPMADTSSAFTPGNLVVTRYGNGTHDYPTTSNVAVEVFIDEYTPEGILDSSRPLPTAANGSVQPYRFTGNSTANTEALLSLSANRQYLVAVGYNVAPGATITSSNSRTIAVVTADGSINTSTITSGNIGTPRSAIIANNGVNIWFAGSSTAALRYKLFGSGATEHIDLITSTTNGRSLAIYDEQLYMSTSAVSGGEPAKLGPVVGGIPLGMPTSGTPVINNFSGLPANFNASQFILLDKDTDGEFDLLYYVDETNPGSIVKYAYDGGTWMVKGSVNATAPATTQGIRSITGKMVGNTAVLYAVTTTLGTSSLIKMTDANASSSIISASNNAPENLVSAPAKTRFRSVSFTPGTVGI
ncbi:exo-alpha-sialidase [Sphingobacterium sp. SGG-5]|uniref:sialidase family protein n=1 Tax=Sphingobacterium sp. SGG-5 TaxID=2710881 RepID=UPI0013E9BAB8|nr:sialidase family protein [Sphingobacterium sp. SGG-5]NGM61485.1 exo-alpha-sialidase [Sphingobacterium sp. SGG-5]